MPTAKKRPRPGRLRPEEIRQLTTIVRDAKRRGVAPEILREAFARSLANAFRLPYVAPRYYAKRQLSVAELNALVERLAAAPDRASGDALRQQILEGFYGRTVHVRELRAGGRTSAAGKRPKRVVLPEFKALMAKGSTRKGTTQADLDDVRGDR